MALAATADGRLEPVLVDLSTLGKTLLPSHERHRIVFGVDSISEGIRIVLGTENSLRSLLNDFDANARQFQAAMICGTVDGRRFQLEAVPEITRLLARHANLRKGKV